MSHQINWKHVVTGPGATKPENYFMQREDDEIKLVNFGTDTKIEGGRDSLNYYYQKIHGASSLSLDNISIKAQVTIARIGVSASNQSYAGFMIKDEITASTGGPRMAFGGIILNDNPISNNNGNLLATRIGGGSVSREGTNFPVLIGIPYAIEFQKIGNTYYTYIDDVLVQREIAINFSTLESYIGLVATRDIDVVFSGIELKALSADDIPDRITCEPNRFEFKQNIAPDLSSLVVTASFGEESSSVDRENYHLSLINITTPAANRTATITYLGKTTTFTYSVEEDKVEALIVQSPPIKTDYAFQEQLDPAGLVISGIRQSGKRDVLPPSDYSLSALGAVGRITVTLNANTNIQTAFDARINSGIQAHRLEVATPPRKSIYYEGDDTPTEAALTLGSRVRVHYTDGTSRILDLSINNSIGYVSNYEDIKDDLTADAGTKELIITYPGPNLNASMFFEIEAVTLQSLEPSSYPKTTYVLGEDLDLDALEVRGRYNNGDATEVLIKDVEYVVDRAAFDNTAPGHYGIFIKGVGAFSGIDGSFPVSVRVPVDYSKGWENMIFGQSASLNNNRTTFLSGMPGEIGGGHAIELSSFNDGGKIADGHDGINFYYRKLNLNDNFKLEAKVKIMSFGVDGNSLHAQMAFGLMMRDRIGDRNGDTSVYSSSIMYAGGGRVTQPLFGAIYRDNRAEYEQGVTATNTRVPLTQLGEFLRNPPPGAESEANIVIERKNNNFAGSITFNGTTQAFSIDNDIPLNHYDPEHYYAGFFTARVATAVFSSANMTVTDADTDPPGTPPVELLPKPEVVIYSLDYCATENYNFRFAANVKGKASVYYKGSMILDNQDIEADTIITIPFELDIAGGFAVEFHPNIEEKLENYNRIIAYKYVNVTGVNGDIYVSPNGSGDGMSKQNPASFADAIRKLKPNHTIHLLPGNYNRLVIPLYNESSKEDNYKRLFAHPNTVVHGIAVDGDFWHVKGITNTTRPFLVGGSDNVIELCTSHTTSDTGFLVSRSSSANADIYNDIAVWPARNLILNCESYNCKDPAETNADGFGCKLTVGEGNRFIGAVAHHNIDDGFDFYAKSIPIGANTVDYSVAYRNGRTIQPYNAGGDGNGFKLGGEGVPVLHTLMNSIAYENKNAGISSNSNPIGILKNVVSFDNLRQNINMSSYTTVQFRGYIVDEVYSYRKNEKPAGQSDNLEAYVDGVLVSAHKAHRDHSIYLTDSSHNSSNDINRLVTDEFFESVESPQKASDAFFRSNTDTPGKTWYAYSRDSTVGNDVQSGTDISTYKNNVVFDEFLVLTDFAGQHTSVYKVTFDANGGKFEDNSHSLDKYTDWLNGMNKITELPQSPTHGNQVFDEWNTREDGNGAVFTVDTNVTGDMPVYAIYRAKRPH